MNLWVKENAKRCNTLPAIRPFAHIFWFNDGGIRGTVSLTHHFSHTTHISLRNFSFDHCLLSIITWKPDVPGRKWFYFSQHIWNRSDYDGAARHSIYLWYLYRRYLSPKTQQCRGSTAFERLVALFNLGSRFWQKKNPWGANTSKEPVIALHKKVPKNRLTP